MTDFRIESDDWLEFGEFMVSIIRLGIINPERIIVLPSSKTVRQTIPIRLFLTKNTRVL
jgi:hypothetical protein